MSTHEPLSLVLDTQIWLDWLVFDDPGIRRLRNAVMLGRARVFLDAACDAELVRVLAYDLGRHSIGAAAQAAALGEARRLAQRIDVALTAAERASLPQCRDPDDQKLIELAVAAHADALVSKDRALLEMNRRRARALPFRVATPADLVLAP
jgi:putative PIN family toxin of toxin-antitoxin system